MVMMMNEIETFTLMALASEIRKAMKKKKRQTQPQTQAAVTYAHFSLTYFCSSICFFFVTHFSVLQQLRFQTITLDLECYCITKSVGFSFAICFHVFGSFHFLKNHTSGGTLRRERFTADVCFDCEMIRHSIHQQKQLESRNVRRKKCEKVNEPRINVL